MKNTIRKAIGYTLMAFPMWSVLGVIWYVAGIKLFLVIVVSVLLCGGLFLLGERMTRKP